MDWQHNCRAARRFSMSTTSPVTDANRLCRRGQEARRGFLHTYNLVIIPTEQKEKNYTSRLAVDEIAKRGRPKHFAPSPDVFPPCLGPKQQTMPSPDSQCDVISPR